MAKKGDADRLPTRNQVGSNGKAAVANLLQDAGLPNLAAGYVQQLVAGARTREERQAAFDLQSVEQSRLLWQRIGAATVMVWTPR